MTRSSKRRRLLAIAVGLGVAYAAAALTVASALALGFDSLSHAAWHLPLPRSAAWIAFWDYLGIGVLLAPALATSVVSALLVAKRTMPRLSGAEPCCRRCGYMLRGLDAPRCPECGTPI